MRLKPSPATAKTLARFALGAWVSFSALNAQAADLTDIKAAFGSAVQATGSVTNGEDLAGTSIQKPAAKSADG